MEREPLRGTSGVVETLTHHSTVDVLGLQLEGRRSRVPSHVATKVQMRRVYLHSAIRCSAVSGAFPQSGQTGHGPSSLVPVPSGKSVRSPNAVLKDEPGEEFTIQGCPCLPNHGHCGRGCKVIELCPVG
jgi:hypothetical protein